jgi:hypothetical protein
LEQRIAALLAGRFPDDGEWHPAEPRSEAARPDPPAVVLQRVQKLLSQAPPPDERTVVWRDTLEHALGFDQLARANPAWEEFLNRSE